MAQDRYGRRYIARGSSPPSSLRSEDMMRAVKLPQRNCFTDHQMRPSPQRPLRSKTSGVQVGGPRLPRNRIGSLITTSTGDISKMPLRTSSAATLQYVKPVSPPAEARVPPVVTIPHTPSGQQCFDSGLGLDKPLNIKSTSSSSSSSNSSKRTGSIPGYRSRCIDDSESDDDIQTDYVHEAIKTNTELSGYVSTTRQDKPQPRDLSLTLLQKQDSGVDQQMDTLQSPTSPLVEGGSSYDPETYQKHLDEIQRSATEWSRLQEGLTMLLPNTDGDT